MSSSSTETLVDVVMPQMGVSVSEGTIVEWRKQVGDWVEYEEAIVDISTDKIDTEVPVAGRRARGRDPRRGRRRRSTSAPCSRASRPTPSPARRTPPSRTARRPRARPPRPPARRRSRRPRRRRRSRARRRRTTRRAQRPRGAAPRRYSPVVQRIAAEHDVDLDQVQGTGRDGRVRKQDVLALLESGGGAPARPRSRRCTSSRPTSPSPRPQRGARRRPLRRRRPPAGAYQPPAAAPLSRMRRSSAST